MSGEASVVIVCVGTVFLFALFYYLERTMPPSTRRRPPLDDPPRPVRVGDVYRRGNTTITVEGIYDAGWLELRSVSLLPGGKEVITSWAESPASFRQRGATLIQKG